MSDPTVTLDQVLEVMTDEGNAELLLPTIDGDQALIIELAITYSGVPPLYWLRSWHPWDGPREWEVRWHQDNIDP